MARFVRVLIAVVVLFGWMAATPALAPENRSSIEIAAYNTAKIVYTATYKTITGNDVYDQGQGTGVLIAPDKVLTCHHLVSSYLAGTFVIAISDGQRVQIRKNEQVTIIKHNATNDLLLLQVSPAFEETGIKVAGKMPRFGEPILFTGYTVLPVSSLRFSQLNENARGIMLFPVYKGDSGGGVFNKEGELIGVINVVLYLKDGGVMFPTFIGYAMPLKIIQEFLK